LGYLFVKGLDCVINTVYLTKTFIPVIAKIWITECAFIHDDIKRILDLDHDYYHGRYKDYSDGSQTWRSEPKLQTAVHIAHELNKRYLHMKWGRSVASTR